MLKKTETLFVFDEIPSALGSILWSEFKCCNLSLEDKFKTLWQDYQNETILKDVYRFRFVSENSNCILLCLIAQLESGDRADLPL